MKLGVLLDHLRPTAGGAEAHTHALLRRALSAGDDVVLATIDGEGAEGVRTLRVETPRRRPARDRVFAAEGIRLLREAGAECVLAFRHAPGCDVYLPHGGLVVDAQQAEIAARGGRATLRRLARALSPKIRFFLEAEHAVLAGRDGPAVLAVSYRVARRIGELYPAAIPRTVVVPNGVDAEHFTFAAFDAAGRQVRQRLGLTREAYTGLLLAHHPRLKGAATAIRALARPEVRDLGATFHLVLVGGELPGDLRRLAVRLGVREKVHEVGPVEDPRPYYAAADVLVHPTFHDPCSLACLEALAMSVPVITTPVNGAGELMGARGGIVLERAGDPEALAVAVRVLADAPLRQSTGDDARSLAQQNRQDARLDQVLEVCRAHAARR